MAYEYCRFTAPDDVGGEEEEEEVELWLSDWDLPPALAPDGGSLAS